MIRGKHKRDYTKQVKHKITLIILYGKNQITRGPQTHQRKRADEIDLREKSEQVESLIQIKVAMATCGIAAGSKDTMNYFIENLEKNGIAAVVTQTGCMGYCYANRPWKSQNRERPDRVRTCNDRKSRRNHSEIPEE